MSTAGKFNRLLLKGHMEDWDSWIPDDATFYDKSVQYTFKTDPDRFGFPHIRTFIQMYCCGNLNRLEECGEAAYGIGIMIIRVEFGIKKARNFPRQWITTTPGNIAVIDSRFDVIERPYRYYPNDCGERLDTRSEWVEFWAMLNNWNNFAGSGTGDVSQCPFLTVDSLTEPPSVCVGNVNKDNLVASWLPNL